MSRKRRNVRNFNPVDAKQAKEIGRRIQLARKETGGMTQLQLADLLNVTGRSVQDYERGKTVPWKHFERLEEITGRPLRWFLHGDESPVHVARDLGDVTARQHDAIMSRLDELREAQRVIMSRLEAMDRERG